MDLNEWEALVVGVVATGVLALTAFYVLRLLRRRQANAQRIGHVRPEFASDRAYNRLAMARREADVLEAQGTEVARARELVGLADASFRAREFDRAFELAQAAHETLVALRRRGPPSAGTGRAEREALVPDGSASGPVARPTVDLRDVAGRASSPAPAASALPKNKLESQFQLRLLEGELSARAGSEAAANARPLFDQGQAAFGREEYTEALRLALKGRRQLGGSVETLGPSPSAVAPSGRPSPPGSPGLEESAERAASSVRCSRCGHPVVAGDTFCRGCGLPLGRQGCPQCGAERLASDAFCGRCGFRYA